MINFGMKNLLFLGTFKDFSMLIGVICEDDLMSDNAMKHENSDSMITCENFNCSKINYGLLSMSDIVCCRRVLEFAKRSY